MTKYSIRDLELLSGIKAHTIRIWEKRYSIISPERTSTNIRYYSDDDLRRILNVSVLNKNGYRISDISHMSGSELNRCILEAGRQNDAYDIIVNSLLLAMMQLDEKQFDDIIMASVENSGFEITLTEVVRRFMEKVGLLWQTGSVSVIQEHFISSLLRNKIILAIENEHFYQEKAKLFLLFLPGNEYHELALLFFHYMLRKAGHRVVYLGQNVPLELINQAAVKVEPDYMLTSITINMAPDSRSAFIREIEKLPPHLKVLIGGRYFDDSFVHFTNRFIRLDSTESFKKFLDQL